MSGFLARQRRYGQMLALLTKHDMGFLLDALGLHRLVPEAFRGQPVDGAIAALSEPERVRVLFEELGPTFVKMGQILSTRPDLVPKPYIEQFKRLQDHAKQLPFADIKGVVEDELGPVDEAFASVSEEPLAAASIGQVHEVTLKDGTAAVIKVQRPGIEATIRLDLALMQSFAELADRVGALGPIKAVAIVREFERSILAELDFVVEGRRTDSFREQHAADAYIVVPKVFWDTSRKRVLTLELIRGTKISEIERLREGGHDLKLVAKQLVHTVLRQVMIYGLFHADPHPGNIMILEDSRIALLDFGMSGRFDRYTRAALTDLARDIAERDHVKLADHLLQYGLAGYDADQRTLQHDIRELFRMMEGGVPLAQASEAFMKFIVTNHISFPPDLFFLDKVFGTLDGAVKTLDPDLSMGALAKSFLPELAKATVLDPKAFLRDLVTRLMAADQAIVALPADLRRVLLRLDAGHLTTKVEHSLGTTGTRQLSRMVAKVSLMVLGAALMVTGLATGVTVTLASGGAVAALGAVALWWAA